MKKILSVTWIAVILSVFASVFNLQGQYYKFLKYGSEKGICHPFVYSVNQDKNGFIWALTGYGLCKFDGFTFSKNGNVKDSLSESSAEASFKDKDGNLWFGYSDGSIAMYDGFKFKFFKPSADEGGKITSIVQSPDGMIVASSQNLGLITFNANLVKKTIKDPFQGKLIYTAYFLSANELLLGTDDGVWIYSFNSDPLNVKEKAKIEGLPLSKVTRITKSSIAKSFWVSTEDAGFYLVTLSAGKYLVENFGSKVNLATDNIQSISEDTHGNVWLSTFGKGLFKVILDGKNVKTIINYNSTNGLGKDEIKDAFEDREGNIWVATFGGGLANLPNTSFISFDFSKQLKNNNVHAVCFDNDGYWVGGEKGLIKVNQGVNKANEYFGSANGLPADVVTALFIDTKGTLWIGTDKSGVYQMAKGSKRIAPFFRGDISLDNSINSISGHSNLLYIATKNGVYQFNLSSGKKEHFSTSQGLPHNDIHQVYIDSKGNAWVATHSNTVFSLNNDTKHYLKDAGEIEFNSVSKDTSGNMWAATNGSGLFKFITNLPKDTFNYFSTREGGLKSDYCYALVNDKFGNTWVGHRMGVSRINGKTGKVKTFGTEFFTGDINLNAIAQNKQGDLLFGTTDGLVVYEPTKDNKTSSAPVVNVTLLNINDSVYDLSKKIVLPYGNYRIKIQFIGLNYSNPEQVTYQYKMDGFESKWSELSGNREAVYSLSQDNTYTFMVKACNGDGVCTEVPVSIEIKISKPLWKRWWFISLMIIALVGAVYFIIQVRERKQKEFQAYLERLLDERTREVREQKEEIELKNRDITDSINYAQRIQASILPSLRKLQHIFSGSFVYYLPRNIVSGDFYWFEVIPNTNKFLIVCADSTGHGVPGAFMSIIGTTLLKDIFSRPEVHKPSDILQHLDNELKSTLNQDQNGERPNDGMDIIVCEIDIKTYYARFSSAMRPFIVYQNGEQLYFKGSRSSIGGQAKEEKIFEDVELQLTKGDLIYMFSDGYPDQFGGPLGKKFKMVRLRNLLKDIYQKPMEEQYNYVKSNFELWKNELEQVDDVLFMGIKI
jgi:Two component regulator propeller./Stage II sporulation protein E (SpoIIE)./Y_Y_Y domain.